MKILITSGGTRQKIDDFRVLTNISTGKLGVEIARVCQERGHTVDFVHCSGSMYPVEVANGSITIHEATDVHSLDVLMQQLVPTVDAVVHAAAVSDFEFVRDEHAMLKCKSDDPLGFVEYMGKTIRRTPKLIQMVKRLNREAVLVGFKFEGGLSNEDLLKCARKSIETNKCDLVVANDKAEMKREREHVAYLVPKDGDVKVVRSKPMIAEAVVSEVERLGTKPK